MLSIRLALGFLILTLLPLRANAQGGYTKEKYPEHGLRFELARDYRWLAIQPGEEWMVLNWGNSRSASNASLSVVRIDHVSEVAPVTPGERRVDPKEPEGKGSTSPKQKPLPINSWRRYSEQVRPTWKVNEVTRGKPRDGYEATEFRITNPTYRKWLGWAYVWEKHAARSFVVVGWALPKDFDAQVKIWRRMAERMHFDEPVVDPEIEKLRRFYARRPKFKNPEYRIRVRTRLDGKWKSEDTENYLVIHNTKDQPLVRRIVRDMESIRKEYMRLFPPAGEIQAVSTVRVCADRNEYLSYGAPSSSAGYWSYVSEELVFYDGTKRSKGKKTEKEDTFIVLYHEAFHQFIHYSVGRLAPHIWFNEGYGDYFSGALIRGGKVKKIGVNPWRLGTIQRAIRHDSHTHLREFVKWTKKQYYGSRAGYAQGWSLVYFLNEARVARKHAVWSKILPTYFDTLKDEWARERLLLGDHEDEKERASSMAMAEEKVRELAYQAAFRDVDFVELEEAWMKFTLSLENK